MSPKTVSRQFFLFLIITSALLVAFTIRLTYQFARSSQEGAKLTHKLQLTFALNQELHHDISAQINLLHRQFEDPDPRFPEQFSAANFDLGEKQIRYLKLDIEERERLAVERIKSLQSELGVLSMQIYKQLQKGDRPLAMKRINRVEAIGDGIDREFSTLNELQVTKLQDMLNQMNNTVDIAYRTIYAFAAGLILALITVAYFFRKRVLHPVRSILLATDQIRQGNLSARAFVSRPDEIGQLAQEFNFMAESLAESYAGLERKVEERTRQLQELQQQLVQSAKMSAAGELISGTAHELNNPLTAIMGFTELACMKLIAEQRDPKEIKRMEEIYSQAERCRRIVANLLQFARHQEPHLEEIRLNDVVEGVLQLRAYEWETRNIHIVREFDGSNPRLCADPNKIQQIILNLLNNAYDAIEETGRAGTIRVCTQSKAGYVRLEVLDDGTGIREPERVFDPFYTTKEVGRGTGLGLSVCYGIVKEHHGEIRAENRAKGACFIVTLPVGNLGSLRKQEPVVPEVVETESAPPKHQALIVDDEETLVQLQVSFLSMMGIHARGAKSGEEAVQILRQGPIGLIVSDVRMPGRVNGLQLYEWVRQHRPSLAERFLFVSGDVVSMTNGSLPLNSSVPRIQKPFTFEEYSRIINQLLENKDS